MKLRVEICLRWASRLVLIVVGGAGFVLLFASLVHADQGPSESGSFRTAVDLEIPQFRGLAPKLRLVYDSGHGDGILGVGWRLTGMSSFERVSTGRGAPRFGPDDEFLYDGTRLLPCTLGLKSPSCQYPATPADRAYAAEVENFRRITYRPVGDEWLVWEKSGIRSTFRPHVTTARGTASWHLTAIEDTLGNRVDVTYRTEPAPADGLGGVYPETVAYGGTTIRFHYGARPDPLASATGAEALLRQGLRLTTIDVRTGDRLVRAYALRYTQQSAGTLRSWLSSVQQYGRDAVVHDDGTVTGPTPLRPVVFAAAGDGEAGTFVQENRADPAWGPRPPPDAPTSVFAGLQMTPHFFSLSDVHSSDLDGDGRSDWFQAVPNQRFTMIDFRSRLANAPGVPAGNSLDWPFGQVRFNAHTGDLNGDRLSDILFEVWRPGGPNLARVDVQLRAALSRGDGTFRWAILATQDTGWHAEAKGDGSVSINCQGGDANGDGLMDLQCAYMSGEGDHYLATALTRPSPTGTWQVVNQPVPFAKRGYARAATVGDTDGDGRSDVLMLDPRECNPGTGVPNCLFPQQDLVVARSTGDGQYQIRSRQPTSWEWGRLAGLRSGDINGDGRDDLVRMESPRTWDGPGLIHSATTTPEGGFALHEQEVPRDLIDQSDPGGDVQMGDANGDGLSDLIFVNGHEAHGGRSCSEPITYKHAVVTRVLAVGDGTFRLPVSWDDCAFSEEFRIPWNYRGATRDVRAPDVNGDGRADFLMTTVSEDDSHLIVQDAVSRNPGLDTYQWTAAELDGDGRQDLVYVHATPAGNTIHALRQRSDGGYAATTRQVLAGQHEDVSGDWKVMDVDSDGRHDLVHVTYRGGATRVTTVRSAAWGQWQAPVANTYFAGERVVATPQFRSMDVNGDGKDDLVLVETVSAPGGIRHTRVRVLRSLGNGTWSAETSSGVRLLDAQDSAMWRTADVDGDGRADLVHLRFLNPGLTVRVLFAAGPGQWRPAEDRLGTDLPEGADWGDTLTWRPADLNSDGKTDLVHPYHSDQGLTIHALLSNGDGSWTPRRDLPLPGFTFTDTLNWRPADVNGDGATDLVHTRKLEQGVRIDTLTSRGDGTSVARMPDNVVAPDLQTPDSIHWMPVDANGDGKSDLRRVDRDGTGLRVTTLLSRSPPDLLVHAVTSAGAEITVRYLPSSAWGQPESAAECRLPAGQTFPVAAEIVVADGTGASADVGRFSYRCPRWSYPSRSLLGWTEQTERHDATVSRPTTVIRTSRTVTPGCGAQPGGVQLENTVGRLMAKTEYRYGPDTGAPHHCDAATRVESECDGPIVCASRETTTRRDEFGNEIEIVERQSNAAPVTARTSLVEYAPATSSWIVGLPWREALFDGATATGTPLRDTRFCYDDAPAGCRTSPVTGQLTAVRRLDTRTGSFASVRYRHDQFGNPIWIEDANGHRTTITYDEATHQHPVRVCNHLRQCHRYGWDEISGDLVRETDPNGRTTRYLFDTAGRSTGICYSDGTRVGIAYINWGDPRQQHVQRSVTDGTPDGLWSQQWLDGLGRVYRNVREGTGHTPFVQDTSYVDTTDQPHQESSWYQRGVDKPRAETFRYDIAGRAVEQRHPDGTTVGWKYGADESRTFASRRDELNHSRTVYTDTFGRSVEVHEFDKGAAQIVRYGYDAADRPVTMVDQAGNRGATEWDSLDRPIRVDDPDRGRWTYRYDPVGNLTAQTDARGDTVRLRYDALDRLIEKRAGPDRTVWRYDEPGHGAGIGRLTSVSDPSAQGCTRAESLHLTYTGMGQISREKRCVLGRWYAHNFSYDQLGRHRRVVYPDGETVRYGYDSAGRLRSVQNLINRLDHDANGLVTAARYANGATGSYAYDNRDRLVSIRVESRRRTAYQVSYRYRPNGLIASTSSRRNRMNLSYSYDDLDRLTKVTGDVQESYTYDAIGNLTSKTGVGVYKYPAPCGTGQNCTGPHAVVQAGDKHYGYDRNGNMTGRAGRRIVWNTDNLAEWIQDRSGRWTFQLYDAFGTRVLAQRCIRGPAKSTATRPLKQRIARCGLHNAADRTRWYGQLVQYSAGTGLTKNYYANTTLLAQRSSQGRQWLVSDQLGSPRLTLTATGRTSGRYDYRPYGQILGPGAGPPQVDFAGSRPDRDTGLDHMGARYYDPALARFISPDPTVPDPFNPQSLNRYAFGLGNPVSYADPTGYEPVPYSPYFRSEVDPIPVMKAPARVAPTLRFGAVDIYGHLPPPSTGLPPEARGDAPAADTGKSPEGAAGSRDPPAAQPSLQAMREEFAGGPLSSVGLRFFDLHAPRPSYLNTVALDYATRHLRTGGPSYIKFAELLEAGHVCAACHLTHNINRVPTDAEFDFTRYHQSTLWTSIVSQTLQAALAIGGQFATTPTSPASRVPPYPGKGKVQGILVVGGREVPLISGYKGPAASIPKGTRGFNNIVRAHVEGHAAAVMRLEKAGSATLYLNKVPCPQPGGCNAMLPRMLPPGAELRVVAPGFDQTYIGVK